MRPAIKGARSISRWRWITAARPSRESPPRLPLARPLAPAYASRRNRIATSFATLTAAFCRGFRHLLPRGGAAHAQTPAPAEPAKPPPAARVELYSRGSKTAGGSCNTNSRALAAAARGPHVVARGDSDAKDQNTVPAARTASGRRLLRCGRVGQKSLVQATTWPPMTGHDLHVYGFVDEFPQRIIYRQ
jgi:hypothetical protein